MDSDVYRKFYEIEKEHWWFKGMRHLCSSIIERYAAGKYLDNILDIGCGTGGLTESLGRFGRVVAADDSPEALDFCVKRGLSPIVRTTAEKPAFKENVFSAVVAFGLIEHLDNDEIFLSEMYRVLKSGGNLIMLTSAFRFLWSSHDEIVHHKKRYTAPEIKVMLTRNGFSVKKLSYVNFFLFPSILIMRTIQRVFNLRPDPKGNILDVVNIPPFLRAVFYKLLCLESAMLKYIDFPFGVGIICVAQKQGLTPL